MLQTSADWLPTEVSETSVEFQRDEKCFLVVHETQIAIYEPTKLECVKQVLPGSYYSSKKKTMHTVVCPYLQ